MFGELWFWIGYIRLVWTYNSLWLIRKEYLSFVVCLQPISKKVCHTSVYFLNSPRDNFATGSDRLLKSQLIFNIVCNISAIARAVMKTKMRSTLIKYGLSNAWKSADTHLSQKVQRTWQKGKYTLASGGWYHLCTVATYLLRSVPVKKKKSLSYARSHNTLHTVCLYSSIENFTLTVMLVIPLSGIIQLH